METQETISAWGRKTFGEPDALAIGARMNCEVAELLVALRNVRDTDQGPEAILCREEAVKECGDVYIMLVQVADALGADLQAVVEAKMMVNRDRSWGKTASGKVQHVEQVAQRYVLVQDDEGKQHPPLGMESFVDAGGQLILMDKFYAMWDNGAQAWSAPFDTADAAVAQLQQSGYEHAGIAVPTFLGNAMGWDHTDGINIMLGRDLYVFHANLSDNLEIVIQPKVVE